MNKLAKCTIVGVISAVVAFAIVWIITLIRDTSLLNAIRQPTFWLVESVAIAIAIAVVASESDRPEQSEQTPMARVATHAVWAAVAAVVVGALLAVATETPAARLLTSIKFLVPAGIAVSVAALEAWPTNDDTDS